MLDVVGRTVEPVLETHLLVQEDGVLVNLGLDEVMARILVTDIHDTYGESNDSDDECHRCQYCPEFYVL